MFEIGNGFDKIEGLLLGWDKGKFRAVFHPGNLVITPPLFQDIDSEKTNG